MSDGGFRDRVVLVTGVGRAGQIGHAVALAFGRGGARLVAADLDAVGVSRRVSEFQAAGIEAQPIAGDLTIPDIAALAVETAMRHYGRLDAVVNVAGGLTTFGPIAKASVRDFDREIAINVKTAFLVSQAAVESLAATHGAIVNFASIAVLEPQSPMAVYSAAKWAVAGLTLSLARELADRHIRVNAIAPGMVRTPDNVASAGTDAPYVELEDICGAVLDLADPASTLNGTIRPIRPRGS
ncbi:MAG TPA: SDR family oxidoreductase [Gemmatimonadales bacterium]|nr:SDR family oxidoreductase [Gemmatimonadales bacterium]